MIPARFAIEGDPERRSFPGVHDPARHWNGWAVPYFTRETVKAVFAECAAEGADVEHIFRPDGTLVVTQGKGDDDPYTESIPVESDGTYCLGLGWVWLPVSGYATRVTHIRVTRDDKWRVDAGDSKGNFTELCYTFETFDEAVASLPDFVTEATSAGVTFDWRVA